MLAQLVRQKPHTNRQISGISLFDDRSVEKRLRVGPVAISRGRRDIESGGSLIQGKAREITQLHECRFPIVLRFQCGDGLIESNKIYRRICRNDLGGNLPTIQFNPVPVSTSLDGVSAPCLVHEDPPHRFRGCCEEMATISPERGALADESHVRLVD